MGPFARDSATFTGSHACCKSVPPTASTDWRNSERPPSVPSAICEANTFVISSRLPDEIHIRLHIRTLRRSVANHASGHFAPRVNASSA
eukprot:2281078-Alexandrium_andersonii.AAC.1